MVDEDAVRLRERAARLLALAMRAQEHGQTSVSMELTTLASDILAHAEDIEDRSAPLPRAATPALKWH